MFSISTRYCFLTVTVLITYRDSNVFKTASTFAVSLYVTFTGNFKLKEQ